MRSAAAISVLAPAIMMCVQLQTARAADAGSAKGDYEARAPRRSQSVVPKSIYLTPKSDKLEPPKSNHVDPPSRKAGSAPAGPVIDEPWVAKPNEALVDPDALSDDAALPEITIPFDPHVRDPAKTAAPVKRAKPKRKARRRPIDVAMRNGRLKLNRFHTVKMEMPHRECRKFPDIFVADYDLPRGSVDVLADNLLLVQKRICADNGAVMVTCYQDNATISIRRARPDDGCKR